MKLGFVLGIGVAVALMIWGLNQQFPGMMNEESGGSLVYALALLVLIGPGVLYSFKGRVSDALWQVLIWGCLLILLVLLYSFRDDAKRIYDRIAAELVPSYAVSEAGGSVSLRRSEDGHYHATAQVNGQDVRLMVDTGASLVVLSYDDAVRVGIDASALSYRFPVNTANGLTMTARVRLNRVQIGDVVMDGVTASVAKPGKMDGSLLGLSFLDRLSGYRFEKDLLVLEQ